MSTTPATSSKSRGRGTAAGILGVLAVVGILVASLVWTLHAVVLSPDAITAAVVPVGSDPQVQAAVASKAAEEIVDALGVETRAENLIGTPLGPLVAPSIANGIENRLAGAIEDALASPAFQDHWEQLVHGAATATINVLRGDSAAVTTSDGVIYLNLLPVAASTIEALKTQGIIDASIQLPDLSDPSTPAQQAIASLSTALGISLPPDFGQVPIAQTAALEKAQGAVAAFDAVALLLIVVAVALAAAAIALAADRLAMTVRIGIGAGMSVAVVPPLLRLIEQTLVSSVAAPGMSVVAGAFTGTVIDAVSWPLRVVALVCLSVALVGMLARGRFGDTRRPAALLPLLFGALVFLVVWIAVGPDAALLGLALVTAGAWIAGPSQLAAAPAAA